MKQHHYPTYSRTANRLIIKLLLLVTLAFGYCTQSAAQSGKSPNPLDTESLFKNLTPPTPAASALIQNIVYPMNYSTGLPDIKIPLYEVKCGDLTLPIYLSYHASGIKLSDVSGLVGLGWNLTAEPMITRSIKGGATTKATIFNASSTRVLHPALFIYTCWKMEVMTNSPMNIITTCPQSKGYLCMLWSQWIKVAST